MDKKENKMFCFQCQETAGCSGCTVSGVCGKKPDVAAMQDLLVYVTRGISAVTTALRREGKEMSPQVNHLITLNLFTTITNANFDKESIAARIREEADPKREYRFMEFCGGHTHVLSRWGLGDILPESIRMIHGPAVRCA